MTVSNVTWVLQVLAVARPERDGAQVKTLSGDEAVATGAHEPWVVLAPDVWPVTVPPAAGMTEPPEGGGGGGGAPASAGGGGGRAGEPAGGVTVSTYAPCHPPTEPS